MIIDTLSYSDMEPCVICGKNLGKKRPVAQMVMDEGNDNIEVLFAHNDCLHSIMDGDMGIKVSDLKHKRTIKK